MSKCKKLSVTYSVYRRSDHELLIRTLDNLQSVNMVFMLNTKLYRSKKITNEHAHRLILEAISSGDPLHAETVVRDHIQDAGISFMERMQAVDWERVNR